jgi:DNA-binding transcriptional LysR family regulator
VVRARSFRAAAHERGQSQGTVSQQLQKLEATLGARLLERDARGCRLTFAGAEFLDHAERLMRLNARALAAVHERTVALGASPNIGIYLLQPYLKSYREEHGQRAPLDVHIHQNPVIARKLEDGEIDIAAMEWWDGRPGFVVRPWRREELVVIVPPDHPWVERASIPRALLKDAPLLGGEPGTGTGRVLARYFGAEFGDLRITMHLGSTEAVKRWVQAGLGVSLVLAGTVAAECRAGTLVAIPLEGESPSKELYVIWRASPAGDAARAFGEWLSARLPG